MADLPPGQLNIDASNTSTPNLADLPQRTSTYKQPFTHEGKYLVIILFCCLLSIVLPCCPSTACWLYCVHWFFMMLVWALEYAIGLLLICLNMSSSGSVLVCDCFVVWCCRYVSDVPDVGLMCCLLHVIHLPLVVSCIVYVQSWWLCQSLSHWPTVCHLLAEPLQLTLWGEMQTLMKHHCHSYAACLITCCDVHHHSLAQ